MLALLALDLGLLGKKRALFDSKAQGSLPKEVTYAQQKINLAEVASGAPLRSSL